MSNKNLICRCLVGLLAWGPATRGNDAPGTSVTVGDARLQVRLSDGSGELTEVQYVVDGQTLSDLRGTAWTARIDGTATGPSGVIKRAGGAKKNPVEAASYEGDSDSCHWTLSYQVTGRGRVTKTLTLVPKQDVRLEQVTLWQATDPAPPVVARTDLQDITAIYRRADRAMFVSLDFPYSRIESAEELTTVSYPPFKSLRKGEVYAAHSLTLGAVSLTGHTRYQFDSGEVRALDAYVQERFALRFDRPLIVACSINNRYTQPRGDIIFHTMKDHPTLRDNTSLLERELDLMPKLGVEYYQVFPGVFDWGPVDPSPAEVTRLMDVARRNGVRMGDYSATSVLFCPHYNEHRNRLDRPDWQIQNENRERVGRFCFGHSSFVDHYIETVVPNCRRFGFKIHCLDFLSLMPCHAFDHGHPPGRDSLYHQVSGLVRLLKAIDSVSPEMMSWSNSGNWAELLPKIAWFNPNLYLTDPFITTPWQGLNMTRLLDDARREQMVHLHHTRFIPYRFLTNFQYFFSQNSIVPDIRHYQYGALSTLAVTPNLGLGEIRPWLDRLPDIDRDHVLGFYHHWTSFVRQHYDLWKTTYEAGDLPGMGGVEVYGHAAGQYGFIFVVNPNYWSRAVDVPLDHRLGVSGAGPCEVAELYPTPRLCLFPQGPLIELGSTLTVEAAAQQVLVLEVRPASKIVQSPKLYGLPGTIEREGETYLIKTRGPQGTTERCAVLFPPRSAAVTSADVRADVPKLSKRLWSPTPLKFWPAAEGALLDVTFRGKGTPTELRDWVVQPGDLTFGLSASWQDGFDEGERLRFPLFDRVDDERIRLPMSDAQAQRASLGPLANFCGGYIENAFSEVQETWIELRTGGVAQLPVNSPVDLGAQPAVRPLPSLATDTRTGWWLQTRFVLPFMYTIGAEPFHGEHTILILPLMRQEAARQVSAWINGKALNVQLYRYPRNRTLGCYYADLVGSGATGGDNRLMIHLQY